VYDAVPLNAAAGGDALTASAAQQADAARAAIARRRRLLWDLRMVDSLKSRMPAMPRRRDSI